MSPGECTANPSVPAPGFPSGVTSIAFLGLMFLSLLGLICFFNTRLCGWLSTENILGFAVNLLVQLLYLLLNLHLLLPLLSSPPRLLSARVKQELCHLQPCAAAFETLSEQRLTFICLM